MGFEGFPDEAFLFYEGLEADSSRAYWTKHRNIYEECVRAPMLALVANLEAEFGTGTLFRPYRDLRFSRDKSPYKTHQGAMLEDVPGIGYYVQISAAGLLAAAGFYAHGSDQIERYRARVDDRRSGPDLQQIVAVIRMAGFEIGGDALKTRPRGYLSDHPRIELLRHKSLYAKRSWPPEPWVHTVEAAKRVRDTFVVGRPLVEWCGKQVGPSQEPARR